MNKKNNFNNKGKKKYPPKRGGKCETPTSDKSVEKNTEQMEIRGHNDIAWYTKTAQSVKDTASLPFGNALGLKYDQYPIDPSAADLPNHFSGNRAIAGIMRADISMVPGRVELATDAFNVGMRAQYNFIRHANSGSKTYEMPDLAMYNWSLDSAFYMYAFFAKIYGLAMNFNSENRYEGDCLILAAGIDPQWLRANLAQYRAALNQYAVKLTSLAVPKDQPIFSRHAWLAGGVFRDGEADKSQLIITVPTGYYQYQPTTSTTGGKCAFKTFNYYPNTAINSLNTVIDILNSIINPLLADEDIGTISGDIIKAYGDNLYTVGLIPEAFVIRPEFNAEFAIQFSNATPMGYPFYTNSKFDLEQANGICTHKCAVTLSSFYNSEIEAEDKPADIMRSYLKMKQFNWLNYWKNGEVSPEDVIYGTRLQACFDKKFLINPSVGTPSIIQLTSVGSDFVSGIVVYTIDENAAAPYYLDSTPRITGEYLMSSDSFGVRGDDSSRIQSSISRFNIKPYINLFILTKDSGEPVAYDMGNIHDFENYTVLYPDTLRAIQDTCLLSLWGLQKV